MRRALVALLALAIAAAVPVAVAATPKTLKQRCASRGYAKKHRRACAKYKRKARRNQLQATVTTSTPSPQATSPGTPSPTAPTDVPPTGTAAPSTKIGVVAREYSLTLSRTSVGAGAATVQLQNFGQDPHNLRVERIDGTGTSTDFPSTGPGTRNSQTVTLAPGQYKLYCTLPGHDAAGMHATLTVG